MKNWVFLLGITALMIQISCSGENNRVEEQENFREEPPTALESAKAIEVTETPQKEQLEMEELPEGIVQYVKADSLLSTLELSKAEKVKMKEGDYYELTFVDEEDQLVMVTLNKEGKVIDS